MKGCRVAFQVSGCGLVIRVLFRLLKKQKHQGLLQKMLGLTHELYGSVVRI